MLSSRQVKRIDWLLVAAVVVLAAVGMAVIASATHVNVPGEDRYWYLSRQGAFFIVNVLLVAGLLHFSYRNLLAAARPLYAINLVMLLAVMVVGQSALGAQRWIQIGPITLQPSEFSKIIMIIALAEMLDRQRSQLAAWRGILTVLAYVGVPFLLVLKQPDLGTALVLVAITLAMMYVAGADGRKMAYLALAATAACPVLWHFLHDYQKNRILVFWDPNIDPLGAGYHIIQSQIAIGSGQLLGKGLFGGTQSQLNFLPENHTDFIFAVIGEEFGLVGGLFVLFLYGVILYRGLRIAGEAGDNFGLLLVTGVVAMLAFHLLVNMGMTMGIMPVTGIPLPLLSYGVSSLTANMIGVGILLNVYMRRHKIMF
ncbi:MAG: rod shape-determining protein RodA [Negativicutes bacterium]|nr:rod shape-determining protein RodA [Negativicutes bacterium]